MPQDKHRPAQEAWHPQMPSPEAERAKRTARLLLGIDCDQCGHRVRGEHAGPHADGCPADHRNHDQGSEA